MLWTLDLAWFYNALVKPPQKTSLTSSLMHKPYQERTEGMRT